jgi:hypothetical protein
MYHVPVVVGGGTAFFQDIQQPITDENLARTIGRISNFKVVRSVIIATRQRPNIDRTETLALGSPFPAHAGLAARGSNSLPHEAARPRTTRCVCLCTSPPPCRLLADDPAVDPLSITRTPAFELLVPSRIWRVLS